MKLFSVKESKNINGKKTTINITTEDPQIIKNLLDSVPSDKEQKKASSKKDSIKAKVKEVKPKTTAKAKGSKGKATKAKAPAKPKALPAPKKESKKKATSKKTTVVNTVSDNSFIPKNETIIFRQGKWVITKKAIGGLFTYSLYEKDYCRTQLIFMPNDDKKALNELKNSMKEEFF